MILSLAWLQYNQPTTNKLQLPILCGDIYLLYTHSYDPFSYFKGFDNNFGYKISDNPANNQIYNSLFCQCQTKKITNRNDITLEQEIFDTDTQEVKSRCLSILVLYDLEQKQSILFSDEWRKAISDYDGL